MSHCYQTAVKRSLASSSTEEPVPSSLFYLSPGTRPVAGDSFSLAAGLRPETPYSTEERDAHGIVNAQCSTCHQLRQVQHVPRERSSSVRKASVTFSLRETDATRLIGPLEFSEPRGGLDSRVPECSWVFWNLLSTRLLSPYCGLSYKQILGIRTVSGILGWVDERMSYLQGRKW